MSLVASSRVGCDKGKKKDEEGTDWLAARIRMEEV